MNERYQTIKILKDTHRLLKVLAAQNGETMMDLIDRLARQEQQTPNIIERLRVIRARFDREDTGQGFGRPEVAWAMADDLRLLIEELSGTNVATNVADDQKQPPKKAK